MGHLFISGQAINQSVNCYLKKQPLHDHLICIQPLIFRNKFEWKPSERKNSNFLIRSMAGWLLPAVLSVTPWVAMETTHHSRTPCKCQVCEYEARVGILGGSLTPSALSDNAGLVHRRGSSTSCPLTFLHTAADEPSPKRSVLRPTVGTA